MINSVGPNPPILIFNSFFDIDFYRTTNHLKSD
jgi:hypothetical protein